MPHPKLGLGFRSAPAAQYERTSRAITRINPDPSYILHLGSSSTKMHLYMARWYAGGHRAARTGRHWFQTILSHGIAIPWSDDRGHIELSVVPFGLLHAKIEP